MDTARIMAYTQTLHPRHTDKKSINYQFNFLKFNVHEYLIRFCCKYEIYFELHNSGNVHCHGILWVKDNVKRCKLLKTMTDALGNIVYKDVTDLMKWRDYCMKDKALMEQVLGIKLPIIWTLEPRKVNFVTYQKLEDVMKYEQDEREEGIQYDLSTPSSTSV